MSTYSRVTPARERLLGRLAPQPDGCWYWTGIIDKAGYGRVGYRGRRSETIQRAMYQEFVGPIPDGYHVDHLCHTSDPTCQRLGTSCKHRRCGNPAHLEAVPSVVNANRSGRRLDACVHGHPYTEDNTYIRLSDSRRICVECYRLRNGHPPVRRAS